MTVRTILIALAAALVSSAAIAELSPEEKAQLEQMRADDALYGPNGPVATAKKQRERARCLMAAYEHHVDFPERYAGVCMVAKGYKANDGLTQKESQP